MVSSWNFYDMLRTMISRFVVAVDVAAAACNVRQRAVACNCIPLVGALLTAQRAHLQ